MKHNATQQAQRKQHHHVLVSALCCIVLYLWQAVHASAYIVYVVLQYVVCGNRALNIRIFHFTLQK